MYEEGEGGEELGGVGGVFGDRKWEEKGGELEKGKYEGEKGRGEGEAIG